MYFGKHYSLLYNWAGGTQEEQAAHLVEEAAAADAPKAPVQNDRWAMPRYMYSLRDATSCGKEDVEQFLTEFSKIAVVCVHTTSVALLQLRLCFTEQAKPYGSSADINSERCPS